MKIRVMTTADKGHKKAPTMQEAAGMPVRVTSFSAATPSSKTEALVILTGGSIRSIVCRPGECDLYLSPWATFQLIAPEPVIDPEKTTEVQRG
jgi:hypothetical protein